MKIRVNVIIKNKWVTVAAKVKLQHSIKEIESLLRHYDSGSVSFKKFGDPWIVQSKVFYLLY